MKYTLSDDDRRLICRHVEAPGAFDHSRDLIVVDRDCDLHLEASDGLPDDTWKLRERWIFIKTQT